MDRKEFLSTSLKAGLCCCGALAGLRHGRATEGARASALENPLHPAEWIGDLEERMIEGSVTPGWRRAEKARRWITDLMDHVDSKLDTPTREALFQACGRSCFNRAFGVAPEEKASPEQAEQFLQSLAQSGNEVRQEGGATVIHYHWGRDHQNPQGLIMHDGYCMCPIVESDTPGLSPTFCQCSVGYVTEAMERSLGKSVKVELLESLKMGGSDCRFRIEVLKT